jgi:hypothetical protein
LGPCCGPGKQQQMAVSVAPSSAIWQWQVQAAACSAMAVQLCVGYYSSLLASGTDWLPCMGFLQFQEVRAAVVMNVHTQGLDGRTVASYQTCAKHSGTLCCHHLKTHFSGPACPCPACCRSSWLQECFRHSGTLKRQDPSHRRHQLPRLWLPHSRLPPPLHERSSSSGGQ